MYALHRQVHPPTAVEHCVYCNFFSRKERSLVVAKTSELCVYRLRTDTKVSLQCYQGNLKEGIFRGGHLAFMYGDELLYLQILLS